MTWRAAAAVACFATTSAWPSAVGYIALFGIAVETGVVMVVYLHEALEHKPASR